MVHTKAVHLTKLQKDKKRGATVHVEAKTYNYGKGRPHSDPIPRIFTR